MTKTLRTITVVALTFATIAVALILAFGPGNIPSASTAGANATVGASHATIGAQSVSHHTRARTCNRPPRTGNGGEIVYHGPTRFFEDGTCRRDGDRMFSNRQVRQIIRVMCLRQGPSGPACRVLRSGRI